MTPETLVFFDFLLGVNGLRDGSGASFTCVPAKNQVTLPMPGRLARHHPNHDDGEPVTLLLTRIKTAMSQNNSRSSVAFLSHQQRNRHSGVLRSAALQKHCVVQHFASRLCLPSTLPESATDVLPKKNARIWIRFPQRHARSMFSSSFSMRLPGVAWVTAGTGAKNSSRSILAKAGRTLAHFIALPFVWWRKWQRRREQPLPKHSSSSRSF